MNIHIPELYDYVERLTFFQRYFHQITLLGVGGGLVALGLLSYHWYINRARPCWEIAQRRLDAIYLDSNITPSHCKRFYTDLTDVLKWYFQVRFGRTLFDKTDQELRVAIEEIGFTNPELSNDFENFVKSAITAKFAQSCIGREQAEKDKRTIAAFIEWSVPQEKKS